MATSDDAQVDQPSRWIAMLTVIAHAAHAVPAIMGILVSIMNHEMPIESKVALVALGFAATVFLVSVDFRMRRIDTTLKETMPRLSGLPSAIDAIRQSIIPQNSGVLFAKDADELNHVISALIAAARRDVVLHMLQYTSVNSWPAIKTGLESGRDITLYVQHPDIAIDRQDSRLADAVERIHRFVKDNGKISKKPKIRQVKIPISVRMAYLPEAFVSFSSYVYVDQAASQRQAQAHGGTPAPAPQTGKWLFDVVGHEYPGVVVLSSHSSWADWERLAQQVIAIYDRNAEAAP